MSRSRPALLALGALLACALALLLLPTALRRPPPALHRAPPANSSTVRRGTAAGTSPAVAYREATGLRAPGPGRLDVLLLHGQAFSSATWEALGTLALLAGEGHRAVAIDLPGYGDSPPTGTVATQQGRVAFLERILEELGLERPVLVSPSMSGRFALPFLLLHGDRLGGFVPIAPVGTRDYTVGQYQRVQTPTLILYGDRDTHLGPQALQSLRHLPRHRVAVLPGAGHACYLDKPGDFHRALLGFLGQLQ
uniref:Protein ABHD14A n=1 Tax=Anas zonorhyncha TaxID=75864 RepID=A0A8B9UY55_9AVES